MYFFLWLLAPGLYKTKRRITRGGISVYELPKVMFILSISRAATDERAVCIYASYYQVWTIVTVKTTRKYTRLKKEISLIKVIIEWLFCSQLFRPTINPALLPNRHKLVNNNFSSLLISTHNVKNNRSCKN